ncbi:MAG TPA: hypothetical protein VL625_05565 [Patescibacteria group bacterium]|nr:hypothetical protein [Patescibacteria group bacterium]
MSQKQNENGFDRIIEIELNAAAVLVGVLFWVMLSVFSGYENAWDDPVYWDFGFPGMLVTAFCFGWSAPERPIRRGIWMGLGHGLGALFCGLIHGYGFNLWPHMAGIGVVFAVLLGLSAAVGGFFVRRRRAIK